MHLQQGLIWRCAATVLDWWSERPSDGGCGVSGVGDSTVAVKSPSGRDGASPATVSELGAEQPLSMMRSADEELPVFTSSGGCMSADWITTSTLFSSTWPQDELPIIWLAAVLPARELKTLSHPRGLKTPQRLF